MSGLVYPPYRFRGCRLRLSTNLNGINASSGYKIPYDVVDYDTGGFFDPIEPTKIFIPDGVKKVEAALFVGILNITTNTFAYMGFYPDTGGVIGQISNSVNNASIVNGSSLGAFSVEGISYLETQIFIPSDNNVDLNAITSFVSLNVVE